MSISRHRATDLVNAYNYSLEQQIVGQGSSLVCRDEELWKQVEGLLRDGDGRETHCLGLDPLMVMEESLKAAACTSIRRVNGKGGIQGLAKAFEIVEQAALNLYLGPWRKEYKIVKMYSGMFTHCIKPVLSMPQIEKLFGLLGYQVSSSRHEQLRLQSARVSPSSLNDLLCLSCAFFLARCECRLLMTALGNHVGEAQWELSLVRERQKGNSLQVAIDNTKKKLEGNQPAFEGEVDVDLYTDEQVNGGQRGEITNDNESPRSLTWVTHGSASPTTVKTQINGMASSSSSSTTPMAAREDFHISTLNCQLAKTSPLEPDSTNSDSVKQGKLPCEESTFNKVNAQSHSLQVETMGLFKSMAEANHLCSCLQSPNICLKHCIQCNTLHSFTCALLEHCEVQSHCVEFPHLTTEEMEELRALSEKGGNPRVSVSPTLSSSSVAMSSLVLCDDPEPMSQSLHPIGFHDCCDLAHPNPQALCISCGVFHSGSCRGKDYCQMHHKIKPLGVCSCGRTCSRNPLVLCRYCGNEYCLDCWYRNPVVCACGQTFDQSSPV